MMADKTRKGGKKNRKYGRNLDKCTQYRAHQTREKNKIKRILQSNGVEYAKAWAKERNIKIPGIQRAEAIDV
jgi:hypothetical protein